MKLFTLLAVLAFRAFAGIEHAPAPFETKYGRAVFVDFQEAEYHLLYDFKEQKAYADTSITFDSFTHGLPVFDSVAEPKAIYLDGQEIDHAYVSVPGGVSKVRLAKVQTAPGRHTMRIRTEIQHGVSYGNFGVSSGFFIKDLKDRMFLERFVPSNYEYDNYKMTFYVDVQNARLSGHDLIANGEVERIGADSLKVTYPEFYTSSSVFFHLMPTSKFVRYNLSYTSINGREVPVTIYSSFRYTNKLLKDKAWRVLPELERDYGPWPHPSVIIYGTGLRGGMEYVGATATSLISLGHELFHSYFAKGVMPADGNSGWMDEGLASWRDKGYQTYATPNYSSENLANHSPYTRKTDKRSYKKGRSFFAYIDYQLKANGMTLKGFLSTYFMIRKLTLVTTEDFIHELEKYSGMDFRSDFDRYIYGKGAAKGRAPAVEPENPHHPEYTEAELNSIL